MLSEKKEHESRAEELTRKLASAVQQLREFEKEMMDRQGIERELNDHIRYQDYQKDLIRCEQDLQRLQAEQGSFSQMSYEQDMEKLKRNQQRLFTQRGSLQGEIKEIDVRIQTCQDDLSTDYANIEQDYQRQFLSVKV